MMEVDQILMEVAIQLKILSDLVFEIMLMFIIIAV